MVPPDQIPPPVLRFAIPVPLKLTDARNVPEDTVKVSPDPVIMTVKLLLPNVTPPGT